MNLLLATDVYKLGHMQQYRPGTTKVYSYLTARSGKTLPDVLFYGLQYYLKMLSQPITMEMVHELLDIRCSILGPTPKDVFEKLEGLAKLGYVPLKIKAIPEGSIVPVKNVLMTMTNTHPDFYWVVGFFESLLLKVWNTSTVASYSLKLQRLLSQFAKETCDDMTMVPFQVHDFGYRGCSSEETAALSGSAHLIRFLGTDTVPAVNLIRKVYGCTEPIGLSVPASEHSVMCSFGRENELQAFEHMLDIYPEGLVSIVSDTYDLWNVLTNFTTLLKKRILDRKGKVVFRPDSGDPVKIICGDPDAPIGSPQRQGALWHLGNVFGTNLNEKGYRVLNPAVGLIYGDGFYWERFQEVFTTMKNQGWASSNLVVGMGGLLLQQHSRDTQAYAIKATYSEANGTPLELFKDPITDPGKKSLQGLMVLERDRAGAYSTRDKIDWAVENSGLLKVVFEDGELTAPTTFDEIRMRAVDHELGKAAQG